MKKITVSQLKEYIEKLAQIQLLEAEYKPLPRLKHVPLPTLKPTPWPHLPDELAVKRQQAQMAYAAKQGLPFIKEPATEKDIESAVSIILDVMSEPETPTQRGLRKVTMMSKPRLPNALAMFEAEGLNNKKFDWKIVEEKVLSMMKSLLGREIFKRRSTLLPTIISQFQKIPPKI